MSRGIKNIFILFKMRLKIFKNRLKCGYESDEFKELSPNLSL